MADKKKRAAEWEEAKRRCRLDNAEIAMAKALGMSPRSLIKNIPSRHEPWKAPIRDWIRDLHERKFGKKTRPVLSAPSTQPKPAPPVEPPAPSMEADDPPF